MGGNYQYQSFVAPVDAVIFSFLHKQSCFAPFALSFGEATPHTPPGVSVYALNYPAQSLKLVSPDISLPQFHIREQFQNYFYRVFFKD